MPIEVAHSPNLGIVGAGAYFAGQGNPDDAAKRAQLALARDQMNTDAQLKNAQLAQQADQFSMGQEYDLYKQLASMANNNAQLEYRTVNENDQLQFRTRADEAARYNAAVNENAQMEYRTQAAQADRQAQMMNENMQMSYQQQARKEMMDLQQQYDMARLNHTEELHMGRLQKGLANLDVMLGSGDIDEEMHQNMTAQLTGGLTPLQKRMSEAQILQMEMKSKQMESEIKKNAELASEMEAIQNGNMPKNSRWTLNDSNLDLAGTYTLGGKLHELGGGGGGRSSSGSGGGYGGSSGPAEKPMPIEPAKEFPSSEVALTAEKYADSRQPKMTTVEGKEVKNPTWQKEYDDYTTMRLYNWEKQQHLHRQQIEEAQVRAGERLPKGYGSFQGLPQIDRAGILMAAEKTVIEQRENVGIYTKGDEFSQDFRAEQRLLALDMAKEKWKELYPTAEKDATAGIRPWGQQDDADFMARHPGWTPPNYNPAAGPTPQGRMGPVEPDPITQDREMGVKGAKPLDPIQTKMLETLGKATIQAWSINAPLEVKQIYANDVSEGIALFKKHGSLAAMEKLNPQDYARFMQIDKQVSDLGKRMESVTGGYPAATPADYRRYGMKNPEEVAARALMPPGTGMIDTATQRERVEGRMREQGIIKRQPFTLPATAQEAEAAARESARQWEILKAQQQEQQEQPKKRKKSTYDSIMGG